MDVKKKLANSRERALAFEHEIQKAIVGQARAVRLITISIFARGHVLIEGDVGVGKTTLLRAVSRALGGEFSRVEGTVDMMPSDLIYHTYLAEDGRPRVEPASILLQADRLSVFFFNEINRARPQVHSLLLRLMAERSVSAFNRDYQFPFLQVFADRNMVEREETFELPAAARDRFLMEISISAPKDDETRRRLIFDPKFHDTESLLDEVGSDALDYRETPDVSRLIQENVGATEALQNYVLSLWRALLTPTSAGVSLTGYRRREPRQRRSQPARIGVSDTRGPRARLAGRTRLHDARRYSGNLHRGSGASNLRGSDLRYTRRRSREAVVSRGIRSDAGAMKSPANIVYRPRGRFGSNHIGSHSSSEVGGFGVFRDQAPFLRHPDARRIDIRASLRDPFEEIHVRQFEQRRSVDLYAIVDVSASMAFVGACEKLSLVREICRSIGLFGDEDWRPFRPDWV